MKPVVLGGQPIFNKPLPFVRPYLPSYESISRPLSEVIETGILTKGKYLQEFEGRIADYLGVKHAVAVSSCTMGLLLTFKSLGICGEVIVPSYTFMATVHPLLWLGVTPVFVDVDPETWNLDPLEVRRAITQKTSAIVAVHVFGNPAEIEELEAIARTHRLKLIFDAAHGFGSLYCNHPLGCYGGVEVFSTSPTKLLTTGEGGVVATNNDELASQILLAREYGNRGDYNSSFAGLNGRVPEFSAILGIQSLSLLEDIATQRNQLASHYKERLSTFPGIAFQKIKPEARSSYKDFTILIDDRLFGMNRDCLAWALSAEGIETRKYYDPPVHLHETYRAFQGRSNGQLPVTEAISKRCLSLPVGSHLQKENILKIASAIERVHEYAKDVRNRFAMEQ